MLSKKLKLYQFSIDDLASKRLQIRSLEQLDTLSKDEAIAVFKDALKDAGVSSTWRWDDAQRVTSHDLRIKALKTLAERKIIFNQFIDEQKSKERNEARMRRQQVNITTNIFSLVT